MTIAPIVVRLFKPLSLTSQEGAFLPPYASTVDMPRCLLCWLPVSGPPAHVGWLSEPKSERLFLVCQNCGDQIHDQLELEQRVRERLMDQVAAA
jgi:hypothetical protein